MSFVEVNGRILDYRKYKRELILVKNYSSLTLKDALEPYGFVMTDEHRFFNDNLSLDIELKFSIKGKIRKI